MVEVVEAMVGRWRRDGSGGTAKPECGCSGALPVVVYEGMGMSSTGDAWKVNGFIGNGVSSAYIVSEL